MLPYFPFGDQFDLKMGTSSFRDDDRLIEVDEHYLSEIAQKRGLLAKDHRYYYRSLPETEVAQWDVVEKVLTNLVQFQPDSFHLVQDGDEWYFHNRLTGEELTFTFGNTTTLPYEPLDWVGRHVQEDLAILNSDVMLVAGQLCFLNGWSLDNKFGKRFMGIHDPAPRMIDPTIQAAHKLMERIPTNRPVWRASWNFKISDQLDMSARHTEAYNAELHRIAPELTPDNIGERVFIRIERQTVSRLPRSGAILFGIHTYLNTLADEATDPDRVRRMLGVLRTTPREMLDYKAVTPFEPALLTYLEKRV